MPAPSNLPKTPSSPNFLGEVEVRVYRVTIPRQRYDKEKAKRDTMNFGEAAPHQLGEKALRGSDVIHGVS